MKLSEFDFTLPEALIALRPTKPRHAARLLVHNGADNANTPNKIHHDTFANLQNHLRPNDRLILNDTKVIPARLTGERQARDTTTKPVKIETTLLSPDESAHWLALAKPAKRLRIGDKITFAPDFYAEVRDKTQQGLTLSFNKTGTEFETALQTNGTLPLPPYIATRRATDAQDQTDYQTVFAKRLGAVAAPTASLHFTESLLTQLSNYGIKFSKVTLHVGAGTFLPVKTDDIANHKMHAEWGEITAQTADEIRQTRANGGRIIPVGTTSLRLLESAAISGQILPFKGQTDIFITPGFKFNATDGLITNFHLPKSTLLMLVAAFIGRPVMYNIYQEAINRRYRFFSYGDSSLLFP